MTDKTRFTLLICGLLLVVWYAGVLPLWLRGEFVLEKDYPIWLPDSYTRVKSASDIPFEDFQKIVKYRLERFGSAEGVKVEAYIPEREVSLEEFKRLPGISQYYITTSFDSFTPIIRYWAMRTQELIFSIYSVKPSSPWNYRFVKGEIDLGSRKCTIVFIRDRGTPVVLSVVLPLVFVLVIVSQHKRKLG